MSTSYTLSTSESFTVTHARHMGAKVATDLKRMQRLYGKPTDEWITNYETEIIAYLKAGYLESVCYGFQRGGKWIEPTLKYTSTELSAGASANDDDPGRIKPGANIEGASFTSYLIPNDAWLNASNEDRETFRKELPFARGTGSEPLVNGYLSQDLVYSAGGRSLTRSYVKGSA